MGTNLRAGESSGRRGPYKHHPLQFKRAIVEASFEPGASVARIAREHGLNANQVFAWRKSYREGMLGESTPALLPVTIDQTVADEPNARRGSDCLIIEAGPLRLRIEGQPDPQVLRLVLAELRRT